MTLDLKDLPEVSFAEKDINKIISEMINDYENAYFEQTGTRKKLYPGDPIRIWLYSQALRELQLRFLIDEAAKQNLLKYAKNEHLDNLGAFSRTERFEAKASLVQVKFILSDARPIDEIIPEGTRVSPGGELYFSVTKDEKVTAGQTEITVLTKCLELGTIGNGFTPGQINILVDPLPWIASVTNVEESQGGSDQESNAEYRKRIHLAPEGFSSAGPSGAYEYFTRQYSSLIEDLLITSPSAGVVDIKVLLKDGELPSAPFLEGLNSHLSAKDKRPLTDLVQVGAPSTIQYDLDFIYYIRTSDANVEAEIKANIEVAISEYEVWQRSKIGRDVNPSELIARIILAGGKRVEITAPQFIDVSDQIAVVGIKNIVYGGLE